MSLCEFGYSQANMYSTVSRTRQEAPMSDLPRHPPAGKKRWKATCRNPNENPFRGRGGPSRFTQTVDVDEGISSAQVEEWARQAAQEAGYEFLRLEEVT